MPLTPKHLSISPAAYGEGYAVEAFTASGLCTDYLPNLTAAIEFCRDFYGTVPVIMSDDLVEVAHV